jgi:hypothetical protein
VTVQWKDCKVVTVISPLHQGFKLSSCNRTFQCRTGWKKQCVKQPDCVKCYNEGMFGVDKSNQYLSRQPCHIKSKFHWWKVLFFQSIDIMIVKAIIVFQEFKKENPQKLDNLPVHFGQLEFRESFVNTLLGLEYGVKHSDFKSTCIPSFNENSKRLRCTFCYAHAKLNELPETKCKTLFHCKNCNVNLCFSPDRDCFTKWHSTEGARVRAWVKENGRNKDH